MASVNNIADEITRELRRYSNLLQEQVDENAKIVADELTGELKEKSPKLTGDYRKGWKVKKVGNKFVVHNATDYQLTHLLEKGHAKVGGGRVAPKVHIKPAEEKAIEDYLERIERAVRQ